MYWGHYFRGVGFPWDFSMSYYAMVAFWTTAVRQSVFPQWIPFQQMGYPFALQAQSGMNYLPLWVFPALDIPYTLQAAIVFQCLHVFAGSVGMFMLARHVHASRYYAIVAAIAFQFFGGFYSNAEHVDIIRAFAYAPWLLYVFALDDTVSEPLPRRALLIPLVLYLFVTGGYPGNVISGAVIVGLFVGLQLLNALLAGVAPARVIALAARLAALSLIGCGMALVHVGPLWLYRDQYVRGAELLTVRRETLWLEHLPGLFLSNKTLPGEISMTSTYVSLPVLLFAGFAPATAFKRHWVYVAVGVGALAMVVGDRAFIEPLAAAVLPVLRLSRFPSSDYRVFVAIPLILLSMRGLRAIAEHELTGPAMAVRSVVCLACVVAGLSQVYDALGRESGMALAVAAASMLAIVVLWRRSAPLTLAGCAAVALLVAIDGVRVLPDIPGWYERGIDTYYLRQSWPPHEAKDGGLSPTAIFRRVPATRPPRVTPAGPVRWTGYVNGSYVTTDLTPNVLRAAGLVSANEIYQEYMLREWSPLLLPAQPGPEGSPQVVVADAEIADRTADTNAIGAGPVRQTRYGINEIVYEVSLTEPRLLVENEMYFPGWRARLSTRDAGVIDAVAVNGVFRAWRLPAGTYTMQADFAFPHVLALRLVAATSLFLWLASSLVWWKRARTA